MRKFFKNFLSVVLCFSIIFGTAVTGFASDKKTKKAKLFNVYSDGMLFQQNKKAVIKGTGNGGEEITLILLDEYGNRKKTSTYVDRNNQFEISFIAPSGGYKKYTITLYESGKKFKELSDIVFGEMWLAGGQSNMSYSFKLSSTYEQNNERSEWLRFLYIDKFPTYDGEKNKYPLEGMSDFEKGCCEWFKGTDDIGEVSAVSVYFAQRLQEQLQIPVGVLCPSLGGSALLTWLSREAAENDEEFLAYLKERGNYVSADQWGDSEIDAHGTITANYNKKIAPLRDFAIAGMIWYQGEEEIFKNWEIGKYTKGLEILQKSYGELFHFIDGRMPFIATQIAPYAYGGLMQNLHNNEFVEFQKADPETRSVITIYDVKSGSLPNYGPLHPANKQPVGERFAECALGLVYGKGCTSAATVAGFRAEGDDYYVTFNNVGDGLEINGEKALGFSLSADGKIYVQAEAEIVNENTIKIHSDEVKNPASAAYAFSGNNTRDNVYSTQNGKKFLPLAPFTTDIENGKLYWEEPAWAECDNDKAFFLAANDDFTGFHKTWKGKNATVKIDKNKPFSGKGDLKITSDKEKKSFYASPVMTYKDSESEKYFSSMMRNWSHYSAVTIMVKNDGKKSVKMDGLRLYTDSKNYFAPDVNDKESVSATIPADGKWHKLTFNLDTLYKNGKTDGAVYSRKELKSVTEIRFCFKDSKQAGAVIHMDEIHFTGNGEEGKDKISREEIKRKKSKEFFDGISNSLFDIAKKLVNNK
ncbi:MAG: hypothetical protein MJ147_09520 [Clostridia bacterium]|nr:hypothetical protein [Clostridia bacterium]